MTTKYYIEKIQANIHSEEGATPHSRVFVEIEMGEPTVDGEVLRCDCTLEIGLGKRNIDETDPDDPEYGEITIDTRLHHEGEEELLEEQADIWKEDGYAKIENNLIMSIESPILPEIFSPLDHLLQDTVTGILPRVRMTYSDEEFEDDNDEESDSETEE